MIAFLNFFLINIIRTNLLQISWKESRLGEAANRTWTDIAAGEGGGAPVRQSYGQPIIMLVVTFDGTHLQCSKIPAAVLCTC